MTTPAAIPAREPIDDFTSFGVAAFTTTRAAGDYWLGEGAEPVPAALAQWQDMVREFAPIVPRFASAKQVHGTRILEHSDTWTGWLRVEGADGHLSMLKGIAMAVTIADCVPVHIAHPSGATALLHAGWRGTAGKITPKAIERFRALGLSPADLRIHLGPAICGRCYEVSPDVFEQLTGWQTIRNRNVDLRALLAEQAKESGVKQISASPYCTKCDNDRFFSHRAGDKERQISVLISPSA